MTTTNSSIDVGPENCLLLDLIVRKKTTINVETMLPYALGEDPLVDDLINLLADFQEIQAHHPKRHQHLIPFYVTRWVHYTNKLAVVGFSDEEETRQFLLSRKRAEIMEEREVLQTLDLLTETYKTALNSHQRMQGLPNLSNWHKILFKDVIEPCGFYRRGMAYVTNLDGLNHIYPNHKIITPALKYFFRSCVRLGKEISEYTVPKAKVRYLLALAAYCQFHFVDIHPFVDGNGRIGRFLSKYVLDEILPLPTPMFDSREDYLQSLINGRKLPKSMEPALLYKLLLESAVKCYREIIGTYKTYTSLLDFFVVSSVEELKEDTAREIIPTPIGVVEELCKEFSTMQPGETKTVTVPEGRYKITKTVEGEE